MTIPCVERKYSPDKDKSVMRIGAVAELLGVCVRTIRIYEESGLVKPRRKHNQRLYSFNDVCWLGRIRELINEEGYDIEELARLISLPACWQLINCPEELRSECPVAKYPGKRCWEIAKKRGCALECGACQIYRISMAKEREDIHE